MQGVPVEVFRIWAEERVHLMFMVTPLVIPGQSRCLCLEKLEVYGLTLEQIKQSIEERAANYLKDAVINIRLLSFKFTVIGEVNQTRNL